MGSGNHAFPVFILKDPCMLFFDDFKSDNHVYEMSRGWILDKNFFKNTDTNFKQGVLTLKADLADNIVVDIGVRFHPENELAVQLAMVDEANAAFVKLNGNSGGFMLTLGFRKGKEEQIAESLSVPVELSESHNIRLGIKNDTFFCSVDGNTVEKKQDFLHKMKTIAIATDKTMLELGHFLITRCESQIARIVDVPTGCTVWFDESKAEFESESVAVIPVPRPKYGKLQLRNAAGPVHETSTTVFGGDVFSVKTIDTAGWIDKMFGRLMETFWRQERSAGGLVARIGEPYVFAQTTQNFASYFLFPQSLLKPSARLDELVSRTRNTIYTLRENSREKKTHALFHERVLLEKNSVVEGQIRATVAGATGIFLAYDYVVAGNETSLAYLEEMIEKMLQLGMMSEDGRFGDFNDGQVTLVRDIRHAYLILCLVLSYSVTGKRKYLDVAISAADGIIDKEYDEHRKYFPRVESHYVMEFLESLWELYLATKNNRYYEVIKDALTSGLRARIRGAPIPFTVDGLLGQSCTFDTLTAGQSSFIAQKLAVWEKDASFEQNAKEIISFMHKIKSESPNEFAKLAFPHPLKTKLLYASRGWRLQKETGNTADLWNYRYSSFSLQKLYDDWAPEGNWMAAVLLYMMFSLHHQQFGAFVGPNVCRYRKGQPVILYSSVKMIGVESEDNKFIIDSGRSDNGKFLLFIPSSARNVRLTLNERPLAVDGTRSEYGTVVQIPSYDQENRLEVIWE